MQITKQMFLAYEKVREGGATNMLAIGKVAMLSDYVLDRLDVAEILQNYELYYDYYINEITDDIILPTYNK